MESFNIFMHEYKVQMEKGVINKAYKRLIEYIMGLRTYFKNKYPDFYVSGNIYYGYLDMTYFSLVPHLLKNRKLKIALVFIHESCRFEIWLAGINKQVQEAYWKLLTERGWNKYPLIPTTKGADSIVEHILVANPDFSDLDVLTEKIETGTVNFIRDIEKLLVNTNSDVGLQLLESNGII